MLVLVSLLLAVALAALNAEDVASLNELCSTTNIGSQLSGWCTAAPMCSWAGVVCESGGTFVRTLSITNAAITGTLPSNFRFSSLAVFIFQNTQITGPLREVFFISVGPTLQVLNLKHLLITFDASFLRHLSAAEELTIDDVPMFGTYEFALADKMPNIGVLVITYTKLTGTITTLFDGPPTSISELDLSHNKLTGAVSADICNQPQLSVIFLNDNMLTSFPSCLASDSVVEECDLSSNFICDLNDVNVGSTCIHDTAPTTVVDLCGVCGGNSQECIDCQGVLHGTSTYDECGVCDGDSSTCLDCNGVPNGPAVYDACDVCGGDFVGECVDCLGTPHGTAVYDKCDICNGDSEVCADCAGVIGGTSKYNECGICTDDDDDDSCRDCKGVLFGTSVRDACGVCGGHNNTCKDCAGVPNGHKHRDRCGVCGGNGKSCGIPGLAHKEKSLASWSTALFVIALVILFVGGPIFWWCAVFRRPSAASAPRSGPGGTVVLN